jgi:hypothetical protein
LLRAVRTLPDEDQDAVLALLLQGLTSSDAWQTAVLRGDERRRIFPALVGEIQLRAGGQIRSSRDVVPESDAKMLPVRFPAKTHEQLKAWCEQHGFPMAAVVRGLVDRFLDSQQLP